VRDIRPATRDQSSAEEKFRIVLDRHHHLRRLEPEVEGLLQGEVGDPVGRIRKARRQHAETGHSRRRASQDARPLDTMLFNEAAHRPDQ